MFDCTINFLGGEKKKITPTTETNNGVTKLVFKDKLNFKDYEKIEFADICINREPIKAGEAGFFLLPGGWWKAKHHEVATGRFKEHEDFEYTVCDPHLYVMGINHRKSAYIAVAAGMRETSHLWVKIKNNEYFFGFRFFIDCEKPYEDISVEIREVGGDLSYSAMGREYRKYILENGFVSIKDRLTPELKYAAESVCIRIRQGWKPVPCQILEQTEQNEPPMHVACTFKQVEELVKAYKKAGLEKAEICLVGWNIKGHDGRWPQILPPEETLGGEKDLKELICTAKKLGYTITCHTNSTDAYRIGNNFDENDIVRNKDGSLSIEAEHWSGGRTYNLCPKNSLKLAHETLPPVAELGFYGNHYIDVITATPPRRCYHPEHPMNRREACESFDELFGFAKKLFGCVGCEVGMEHSMKNCDFILYATMNNGLCRTPNPKELDGLDIFDEYVPFWHIVFHGIVLNNPYAGTVNAVLNRNPDAVLRLVELGGRPVVYYYSKFCSDGSDWMGDLDFRLSTENEFEDSVKNVKKTEEIYKKYAYLQYEFMDVHERVGDNRFRTVYSDGTEITVDYNKKTFEIKKTKKD